MEKKKIILLVFLTFSGCLSWSLTMVRSGLVYEKGMGFWGANAHDGIWHIALANQVLKSFPPSNPVFSGFRLTNYHYFYDLFLAVLNKLTGIAIVNLYFQVLPVLMAILIGILSFLVGYLWRKNFWTGFWLVFFNYFAGSFGWIVTFLREGTIGGESLFWSMQSISSLINPPFTFSLIILLLGMVFLLKVKDWGGKKILLTGFLFGILINIKVYAGLIGLCSLAVFSLVNFVKKSKKEGLIFITALIISGIIFLTTNKTSSHLLVFKPLWFIHTMVEASDRLFIPRLALARYALAASGFGVKLLLIELVGIALFLIGNMGTRLVGGFEILKIIFKKNIKSFDWFLLTGVLAGFIPPLIFIQKGTAWNTIQFFYYSLFFMNFFAAQFLAKLMKAEDKFSKIVLFLVLISTLPTTLGSLKHYLGKPPTLIYKQELEGLKFLKDQENGIVLTYPYNRYPGGTDNQPLPIFHYESTAYVSAFGKKISFLEDEMNLEITNYPWRERKKEVEKFFNTQDGIWSRGFLLNNDIDYIYLVDDQKLSLSRETLNLKMIFDNGQVRIYKVLK